MTARETFVFRLVVIEPIDDDGASRLFAAGETMVRRGSEATTAVKT